MQTYCMLCVINLMHTLQYCHLIEIQYKAVKLIQIGRQGLHQILKPLILINAGYLLGPRLCPHLIFHVHRHDLRQDHLDHRLCAI